VKEGREFPAIVHAIASTLGSCTCSFSLVEVLPDSEGKGFESSGLPCTGIKVNQRALHEVSTLNGFPCKHKIPDWPPPPGDHRRAIICHDPNNISCLLPCAIHFPIATLRLTLVDYIDAGVIAAIRMNELTKWNITIVTNCVAAIVAKWT